MLKPDSKIFIVRRSSLSNKNDNERPVLLNSLQNLTRTNFSHSLYASTHLLI